MSMKVETERLMRATMLVPDANTADSVLDDLL